MIPLQSFQESCGSNNAKSRIFHDMTPGVSHNSGSSDPARIQMYFDTDDEEIETKLQSPSMAEPSISEQLKGKSETTEASPEGLVPYCLITDYC